MIRRHEIGTGGLRNWRSPSSSWAAGVSFADYIKDRVLSCMELVWNAQE
jgi:hypothetical protein